MPIRKGTEANPVAIKLGTTDFKKVYKGTTLRWQKPAPAVLTPCFTYHQGGIVIYADGNGGGLIAAPHIITTGYFWDTAGDATPINNTDRWAYAMGRDNTNRIITSIGSTRAQSSTYCLDYSNDGYSDWFLPSMDELWYMTNANGNMWDCLFANWYYDETIRNDELASSNDVDNRQKVISVQSGIDNSRFKHIGDVSFVPCRYVT